MLTTGCSPSISVSSAARKLSACTCHRRPHLLRLLRRPSRGRALCWPLAASLQSAAQCGISICDRNDHRRHHRLALITAKRSMETDHSQRQRPERSASRLQLKRHLLLHPVRRVQFAASSLLCSPLSLLPTVSTAPLAANGCARLISTRIAVSAASTARCAAICGARSTRGRRRCASVRDAWTNISRLTRCGDRRERRRRWLKRAGDSRSRGCAQCMVLKRLWASMSLLACVSFADPLLPHASLSPRGASGRWQLAWLVSRSLSVDFSSRLFVLGSLLLASPFWSFTRFSDTIWRRCCPRRVRCAVCRLVPVAQTSAASSSFPSARLEVNPRVRHKPAAKLPLVRRTLSLIVPALDSACCHSSMASTGCHSSPASTGFHSSIASVCCPALQPCGEEACEEACSKGTIQACSSRKETIQEKEEQVQR